MPHPRPHPAVYSLVVMILTATLLLACGDDPTDPDGGDPQGIGPEGGTISFADGAVRLVVPAGALSDTIEMTATSGGASDADMIGVAYLIEPAATGFDPAAELSIAYDDAELPASADESALRIYRQQGSAWVPVAHEAVDAAANRVRASIDRLGTFAVLLRASVPDTGSAAAYIVDPPLSGSVRFFTDVAPALAYVCTLPADTAPHVIIVRTSRVLRVGHLEYDCDVELRRDPLHAPAFAAPADSVMHIEAQGALVLSGMSISAPAGLLIQAAARFVVTDNEIDGETTVEVVASVAGAGPGRSSRAQSSWSTGGVVEANTFSDNFNLGFKTSVDAAASYAITENEGAEVAVTTDAAADFGAHLELGANLIDGVRLDVGIDGTASVDMHGHASLALLDGRIRARGDHQLTFDHNVMAQARLQMEGAGSVTVGMASNNVTTGDYRFSLMDVTLNSTGDVFTDLALGLFTSLITAPRMSFNQTGGSIEKLVLDSEGVAGPGSLMSVALSGTPVEATIDADLTVPALIKTEDLTVGGAVGISVTGQPLDMQLKNANFRAAVDIEALGQQARLDLQANNVRFDHGGIANADYAAFLKINVVGSSSGAPFYVNHARPIPVPGLVSAMMRAPTAGRDTIVFENAIITASGGNAINLFGVDGSVRITGGTVTSDVGGIWMDNVSGDVLVEGVRLVGGGVSVDSVLGRVVLRNDTLTQTNALGFSVAHSPDVLIENVQATSSSFAIFGVTAEASTVTVRNSSFSGHLFTAVLGSGPITFEGNTFSGPGQIQIGGDGVLTATDNAFMGTMFSIGEGGYVTLTGNTFTDAYVNDFAFGGLLADPVPANAGLDPDGSIMTLVDFDGNGCAEYPTGFNEKDPDTGVCGADGIPPRSAP